MMSIFDELPIKRFQISTSVPTAMEIANILVITWMEDILVHVRTDSLWPRTANHAKVISEC